LQLDLFNTKLNEESVKKLCSVRIDFCCICLGSSGIEKPWPVENKPE